MLSVADEEYVAESSTSAIDPALVHTHYFIESMEANEQRKYPFYRATCKNCNLSFAFNGKTRLIEHVSGISWTNGNGKSRCNVRKCPNPDMEMRDNLRRDMSTGAGVKRRRNDEVYASEKRPAPVTTTSAATIPATATAPVLRNPTNCGESSAVIQTTASEDAHYEETSSDDSSPRPTRLVSNDDFSLDKKLLEMEVRGLRDTLKQVLNQVKSMGEELAAVRQREADILELFRRSRQ